MSERLLKYGDNKVEKARELADDLFAVFLEDVGTSLPISRSGKIRKFLKNKSYDVVTLGIQMIDSRIDSMKATSSKTDATSRLDLNTLRHIKEIYEKVKKERIVKGEDKEIAETYAAHRTKRLGQQEGSITQTLQVWSPEGSNIVPDSQRK